MIFSYGAYVSPNPGMSSDWAPEDGKAPSRTSNDPRFEEAAKRRFQISDTFVMEERTRDEREARAAEPTAMLERTQVGAPSGVIDPAAPHGAGTPLTTGQYTETTPEAEGPSTGTGSTSLFDLRCSAITASRAGKAVR